MLSFVVSSLLVTGIAIAGSAPRRRPEMVGRTEAVGGGLLASALILLGASLRHMSPF